MGIGLIQISNQAPGPGQSWPQDLQQNWALSTTSCCSGSRLEKGTQGGKPLSKRLQKYLLIAGHIWNLTRYMPPATPRNVYRKLPNPVL